MNKDNSILKSSFFFKLYWIPSICWIAISLLAMVIPDETDPEPLTLVDVVIADLILLICWFAISSVITLIINELKKEKSKTNAREVQPMVISNDKIVDKPEIVKENTKSEERKTKEIKKYHHPNFIKNGMIILFVITIASLWGALLSVALVDKLIPQHGFNFTKNMWVFWCWLPIPILSIILGFKYKNAGFKCTKNIVGGFIIGFLLLIYGSFCVFPTFSEDYSKIDTYRNIIDAKIPNNGDLEIQNWGTYFDEDKTEYVIINAYYDRENVNELVKSIENNGSWILSTDIKSELKIFIPSQLRTDSDAYFSIYNKTTNQYNLIPENSGYYEIYAMKYDKSDKHLEIHKFKYFYNK